MLPWVNVAANNKAILISAYKPNNFSGLIYFIKIMSGCGVYDGAEIVEATSAIIHLSKHNANISFFAPNIEQLHVVNHLTGEVV